MKQENAMNHYLLQDRRPDIEVLLTVSPWISELFEPEVWAKLTIEQRRKILSVTNAGSLENAHAVFEKEVVMLSKLKQILNGNGHDNGTV